MFVAAPIPPIPLTAQPSEADGWILLGVAAVALLAGAAFAAIARWTKTEDPRSESPVRELEKLHA